ncbi:MAG TPA: hypothetical protein PLE16_12150 [Spirochaetota bacterium]|nr:hypothetical protein [Spirochaetota bacterium]
MKYGLNKMKVKHSLLSVTQKALAESFGVDMMVTLSRILIPNYDVYQRTGFPENIPIPSRDAAAQIVRDMAALELFPIFVNLLIKISTEGYMGRRYQIHNLRDIIREMHNSGLVYDQVNNTFVEDVKIAKTPNWGVLRNGSDYVISMLRLDIVGNTELVRKYSKTVIESTYSDLRQIVEMASDRRNGRIWSWEGDGGIIAFYFGNRNKFATLCGIEIVNQLYMYNLKQCRLDSPLKVRIAIHNGACQYTNNPESLKKLEIVKKVTEAEANFTKPNTLTITDSVHLSLPSTLTARFTKNAFDNGTIYYRYEIRTEE